MKRVILDIEKDKVSFVKELLSQYDFVTILEDTQVKQGMYSSIVSLQKGEGIPSQED